MSPISFPPHRRIQYLLQDGFHQSLRRYYMVPTARCYHFPEEKVRNEVSIMQFLLEKTSAEIPIPVPSVFRWGQTKESPSELGPFIIMNYIYHERSMGDLLEAPGRQAGQPPVPDPNIESVRLETLYKKLANILLSLSTLSLSRIGSIDKNTFSTRHEDICEVWRSRLHLLEPREVKPIEEYVELKLEEKKEEKKKRNLTWDVDEYTKEWMERMIKKRKKEMEREETFA